MNELYQMIGGNTPDIMRRFEQFRSTFQGDAREQVQALLNSGKITQAQYNNAVSMANQIMRYMR